MSEKDRSPSSERRKFLKLFGAGAVAVPIAGCTDGDSGDGADPTATPTEGEDATTPEGGGTESLAMNYIGNSQPSSTDPAEHVDNPTTIWTMNFYDPMVFIDPEDYTPQPWLASDWSTENDGTTWVLNLRDDVTFHSGNTMTADDVAYTMERTQAIGKGLSSLYADVENAVVRDDTTVAFELSKKFGPFLGTLIHLFVVDSEEVQSHEEDGDWGNNWLNQQNVAGTGPWTLREWAEGEQWIGEKFDDYWGPRPDENAFDVVRYKYVIEESTSQQFMVQGEADLHEDLVDPEILKAFNEAPNVVVEERPSLTIYHFPMNCMKAPTDDLNVRKAIALAYDYDTAINDIFGGGTPAAGPVPPTMPGSNDSLEPYQQDLDAAKAALDESDYTAEEINDIGLEYVWISGNEVERRTGLLLQNNLVELGIDVEITEMPWPNYVEAAADHETTPHIQAIYHGAYYNSPDVFTYLMHHPSARGTYVSASWFATDELTELLEDARQTIDQEERLQKYSDAQEMIHAGYPSVYQLFVPFVAPMNENLGGWTYRAVSNYDKRFADLYRTGDGRAK